MVVSMKEGEITDEVRVGLVARGQSIEEDSFRIIEQEVGNHGFSPDEWLIVRRVIHTTGDLEYAEIIKLSSHAVKAGIRALKGGASIFTDTRMVEVGLSPWRLEWFGNKVITPIRDPLSQQKAELWGTTRTAAAFRMVAEKLNGAIVAIGNAPTALIEVLRLIEEGLRPALIIGVPVGFVQAFESKELLANQKVVPYITTLSRKGGSAVAVAILHGLMECARSA